MIWAFALSCVVAGAGCDWGGGGGGGPALTPLPPLPPSGAAQAKAKDPVVRGEQVYLDRGCVLCHGEAGKGGVKNSNSETGGLINGLTLVKEGYTPAELAKRIREGVAEVGKKDPKGPDPPLHMPGFGAWLPPGDVQALVAYLVSIYPKDRKIEDDWDDDDE